MPGGFGGDSSVKWFVNADNGREGSVRSERQGGPGSKRWVQEGIEEWDGATAFDFTITIKIPKDNPTRPNAKDDFVASLRAALNAAERLNGGDPITITLPVEDKDHGGPNLDQIVVDWRLAGTGV